MSRLNTKLREKRSSWQFFGLIPIAVWIAWGLALPWTAGAAASNHLQLQLLQSQYLSGSQNSIQNDAYSSFALRLKHEVIDHGRVLHGLDLMGLASMDGTEQGYVAAPEFYWGLKSEFGGTPVRWILGRKRMTWSRFDEEWRLGIWQPQVRWDYLHPSLQGLTGAFLTLGEESQAQLTFFVTPLFLPDQGPQFEVVDGQFHSSNRWFRQPTSDHRVINQERRLNYQLDRPSEQELIMNSALGLSFLLGNEDRGSWFRASLANKPINQLHIGIEGYHSIARLNRYLESVAVVHPTVARHDVATVEIGFGEDEYRGWVSVTEERPVSPRLPEDWEEASLHPSRFVGLTIAHRLPWEGFRSHWLKYAAMSLTEHIAPASSENTQDNLESSLDRYPYREVLSLEWTAPFFNVPRRRFDFGLRYLYSIPEKGSLLSAKFELVIERNTRWDFGIDVLGSEVPPESSKSGLMSLYRNNDRITGSYTYVF